MILIYFMYLLLDCKFCNVAVLQYLDTEGSFMVERALQVAEACIEDMSEYSRFLHKDLQAFQVGMQSKDILENIYYFRVCSYTEQIALINYLDKFITEHRDVSNMIVQTMCQLPHCSHSGLKLSASYPLCGISDQYVLSCVDKAILGEFTTLFVFLNKKQVKVVIIDSITFHFRQDFDDLALRTRVLSGMALKLMKVAKTFSLAVRNIYTIAKF